MDGEGLVVPEAVGHWRHLLVAGTAAAALFGGTAFVVSGVARGLASLGVALASWGFVVAFSRLVRSGPQLQADRDGVRCKVWHGYRVVPWSDIVSIGPVGRVQPLDMTLKAANGNRMPWVPPRFSRALGGEDRGLLIRFGPRLMQACYVYDTPDDDLGEVRRCLIAMWRRA